MAKSFHFWQTVSKEVKLGHMATNPVHNIKSFSFYLLRIFTSASPLIKIKIFGMRQYSIHNDL